MTTTPSSTPDFETLLLSIEGPVARVTLNRPERMNGMTNRMVREAADALDLVAAEADVRVLVLTGAGRAFCPGADLQAVARGRSPTNASARHSSARRCCSTRCRR
jgi:enoyl-CoA hydratase/carnithine racemase